MSSKPQKSGKKRRVIVVTDEAGEIIATAGIPEEQEMEAQPPEGQESAGLKALPGQSIHEVEMPDDFFRHESAVDKHKWLAKHRIEPGPEPRLVEKSSSRNSGE